MTLCLPALSDRPEHVYQAVDFFESYRPLGVASAVKRGIDLVGRALRRWQESQLTHKRTNLSHQLQVL